MPLIAISAVYGYSEYKYNNNVKSIDSKVEYIKNLDLTNSLENNNSSDFDPSSESVLDTVVEQNKTVTQGKEKVVKILKLINETKSYTFFDNEKTQHLINSQIIIEAYDDYINTIVKTEGMFGLLGLDKKHYDNKFAEYQRKINETNIKLIKN